jgi:hypothetical protein
VATSNGFILGIDPTDRRRDSGLAPEVIERIAKAGTHSSTNACASSDREALPFNESPCGGTMGPGFRREANG